MFYMLTFNKPNRTSIRDIFYRLTRDFTDKADIVIPAKITKLSHKAVL